ncbi:hypothetical protein D088_470019 [Salmonella enterica subsp. houtenae serovar 16:z4,z32:-- str. RKS3027]|nr:hypothetical protein D088_470019 [Salmonella enterica subsp. houtenae serovar 16:z4,z32:-- str. RKS3027]
MRQRMKNVVSKNATGELLELIVFFKIVLRAIGIISFL